MPNNPYEPPTQRVWAELPLTDDQEKGRRILLAHIALVLVISLAVIGIYTLKVGPGHLLPQAVRFLLTAALCRWTYRGSVTAVRITTFLFGLAGVLGIVAVVLGGSSMGLLGMVLLSAMAAVYLSFAFVLIASPSVDAYFNYQSLRKQRQAASTAD